MVEFDVDGWAVRQVDLRLSDGETLTAAAMVEVVCARDRFGFAAVSEYESTHGVIAEGVVLDGSGSALAEDVTLVEFDRVWALARVRLGHPVAPPTCS